MKRNKLTLYDQNLKPADILLYLPESFKKKLTKSQKGYIQRAFYLALMAYQKRQEERYLDRMLV